MISNWIILLHPLSGLTVVLLSTIVATYGWRYRNARLGKSGKDVMETFNLQKIHKHLGIILLTLTIIVWLLELAINYGVVISSAIHSWGAIALVILLTTSATIILRFRRRRWASFVHLTLNGIILVIITVQLLSGIKILDYLF